MVARTGLRGLAARRSSRVLFDLLVALGAALLAIPAIGQGGHHGLLPALGFGMAVALTVRRRWPVPVMIVTGGLALVELVMFSPMDEPQTYNLAVLVALFTVVRYAPSLRPGLIAAGFVGAAAVAETVRHFGESGGLADGVTYLLLCGGAFVSALAIRTRSLYVSGLEERALTAERERDHLARIAVADERAKIARELHDVVAHGLAVMIVQADGADYALERDPAAARSAIRQVAATGREALEDMGRLVGVLRGPALDEPEARDGDRRRVTLDDLDVLIERAGSANIYVNRFETGSRAGLSPAIELTVYRLVQEALTNVFRHVGPGAIVLLRLGYSATGVSVEVDDDGPGGFPPPRTTTSGGHGLIGMRERVAVHGGSFAAGPATGGGWRVQAFVPISPVREPVEA